MNLSVSLGLLSWHCHLRRLVGQNLMPPQMLTRSLCRPPPPQPQPLLVVLQLLLLWRLPLLVCQAAAAQMRSRWQLTML